MVMSIQVSKEEKMERQCFIRAIILTNEIQSLYCSIRGVAWIFEVVRRILLFVPELRPVPPPPLQKIFV